MREILFKAKAKNTRDWIIGYYVFARSTLGADNVHVMFDGCGLNMEVEIDPTTLCQYTGLTDKNGRKIFEGDILKYKDDYTKETRCEVQFHRCGFMAVWPNDWDAESLDNGFHVHSEVIGNIYDRP